MITGEVGDGWEGVKGLTLALSAHASPRNSPRDNGNNNSNNHDAGAGGGDHLSGTNDNSETLLLTENTNGTAGTTAPGGSVVASGNRARSMFAQRLKSSTNNEESTASGELARLTPFTSPINTTLWETS